MAVCVSVFHKCRRLPSTLLNLRPLVLSLNAQSTRTFCSTNALAARKYTEQHEWVDVQGTIGTVGVTDYAQGALGDVVFAQLPEPDSELNQMDDCGALESVKAASELYSPVSGTVTEKNKDVEETPALINQSPYEKGWLFKIKLSKPEELDALLDEAGYENHLKNTGH
ncbi:glycine cleavage system H protein [Daphnia magna]|uniref:Glycine cleavage system H protein n=1 Tax=Daphnia magna TaxID=35525 RepID=A0A0P4X8M5_9CRUS|nr:glycine cleavage system H protein [Daphnia magna]KZS08876.1 Glycine cleavage system H protein, mitochondrial [Daphnia magna]